VVYLVERYVPGISRPDLERALARLSATAHELQSEGMEIRYLGSTIVPDDETCFCQFEAASEAVVAEANRRGGVDFDRIVPAVAVSPAAQAERGES
jgi:hypothetical protein